MNCAESNAATYTYPVLHFISEVSKGLASGVCNRLGELMDPTIQVMDAGVVGAMGEGLQLRMCK